MAPLSLLLLSLSLLSLPAFSLPEDELSAALSAIRNHPNYSLFANAVATSDLYFTLTSATSSFTLFIPTDPTMFSLDVSAASADEYVSILRRHVVPRRLSLLSLRSPAPSRLLPTLDPGHFIRIQTPIGSEFVSVDGVNVVAPGIFYSRSVAVHGLGSVVVPRHPVPPPIADLSGNSFSPVGSVSPASADVAAPVKSTVRLGHGIMAHGNIFRLQQEPTLMCPCS